MTNIVLDEDQARTVAESTGVIALRDKTGKLLGYLAQRFSEDEISTARRRLATSGPRVTTAEVLAHLSGLAQ